VELDRPEHHPPTRLPGVALDLRSTQREPLRQRVGVRLRPRAVLVEVEQHPRVDVGRVDQPDKRVRHRVHQVLAFALRARTAAGSARRTFFVSSTTPRVPRSIARSTFNWSRSAAVYPAWRAAIFPTCADRRWT